MDKIITKSLRLISGFVIAVGALLAWKFWGINSGLAVIVGLGGLVLVGIALDLS